MDAEPIKHWSVWKHSGMRDQHFKQYVSDEDETYVRYVYRYIKDQMKMGIVQLRFGDEVVNEHHLPRINARIQTAAVDASDVNIGYSEIKTLAAVNPVLRPIFTDYQNGKYNYTTFLELAIINLADFDKVIGHIEDKIWSSPEKYPKFPASKLTTKQAAREAVIATLSTVDSQIESIYDALKILQPSEAYVAFLESILVSVRSLAKLNPNFD